MMLHKTSPVNRLTLAAAAAALSLALACQGCFHTQNDEMTNAVVSGEKPVAMEGSDAFFDGKMAVKVTLSRGIGQGLRKSSGEKGDYTYQKYTTNENKVTLGSPMPPVTLHLILTNRSLNPMTVTVVDFVSDMGNFAVDPDTLTIAPGQTTEPTPMVSDLGVSADEMPFKVTLKYGIAKETRTFPVGIINPGAPAPSRQGP
jgi:plastocyanin